MMPTLEFNKEQLKTRADLTQLALKEITEEVNKAFPNKTSIERQKEINRRLSDYRQGMLHRN